MMQITRKQMKTFNRINEKLKTLPLFFIANYGYLVRKYSYLKKSHYIVKCQLKLKKRRVVILFNQLKKLGLKTKEEKEAKKQYSKNLQKKCRVVRNKSGTSSLQKPKSESKIRDAREKASTVDKEPTQSKALGTLDIETVRYLNGLDMNQISINFFIITGT